MYPAQRIEFFWGEVFADGFEVTRAISHPNAAEPGISVLSWLYSISQLDGCTFTFGLGDFGFELPVQ
jgi:hypothetical protein